MKDIENQNPVPDETAEKIWPELTSIKDNEGPITGKLDPTVVDKIRQDVSKNEVRAQKLIDFIAGRDFKTDNKAWELNTRSVALDLGIPWAIVDVAIRRCWKKFRGETK